MAQAWAPATAGSRGLAPRWLLGSLPVPSLLLRAHRSSTVSSHRIPTATRAQRMPLKYFTCQHTSLDLIKLLIFIASSRTFLGRNILKNKTKQKLQEVRMKNTITIVIRTNRPTGSSVGAFVP